MTFLAALEFKGRLFRLAVESKGPLFLATLKSALSNKPILYSAATLLTPMNTTRTTHLPPNRARKQQQAVATNPWT